VKIVRFVKNLLEKSDKKLVLANSHLSTVELRCKLQEKLHRVTGP
jgi:hypothetical protein